MTLSIRLLGISMICLFALSCEKDDPEPTVAPARGSVFVTVTADGTPVVDTRVVTIPATTTYETRSNGTVLMEDLPLGVFMINATKDDFGSNSTAVNVTKDELVYLDIELIEGLFEEPIVSLEANGPFVNIGDTAVFQAVISDNGEAPMDLTLQWAVNSVEVLPTAEVEADGSTSLTQVFDSVGTHTVSLTVTDSDGFSTVSQLQYESVIHPVVLDTVLRDSTSATMQWTVPDITQGFAAYKVNWATNGDPLQQIAILSGDPQLNEFMFEFPLVEGVISTYSVTTLLNNGIEVESNVFVGP